MAGVKCEKTIILINNKKKTTTNRPKTKTHTNKQKPTWTRAGDWTDSEETDCSCHVLLCCLSLRLWQALTYRAASKVLTLFSPSTCCILIWSESDWKSWSLHSICVKNFVLMSWYALHCSSKCVSVSTCLCGQSWHSQVCRCWPVSMARLWSLSLYIVKVFLSFSSFTVVRYSASVYCFF